MNRVKKLVKNIVILMVISIILGSTLKSGSGNILKIKIYYTLAIFMNLIPIAYFILKFKKAKKRPIYFIGFVFYYLLILPFWTSFAFGNSIGQNLDINISNLISLNIITGLNILLLLISQIFIMKYVFIDIISGRRKAKNTDIGIVFLTYMTIGITFAFIYIIVIKNNNLAISGILGNYNGIEIYFRSIYFSFITLTSVGYGEIIPVSLLAQGLVTLESVLGVLLLSFSLGIVFSSNLNNQELEEKNKKLSNDQNSLKKQLMKEFEASLDKNLEKYKKEREKG